MVDTSNFPERNMEEALAEIESLKAQRDAVDWLLAARRSEEAAVGAYLRSCRPEQFAEALISAQNLQILNYVL